MHLLIVMLWVVDSPPPPNMISVSEALIIFVKNKKVEGICTYVQLLGELR